MVEKTRFGILLKRYRQAMGCSQETLAERAGLSTRAISDLERGINRAPRQATFDLLVEALALTEQQSDFLRAAMLPAEDLQPEKVIPWVSSSLPQPPTRLIGREAERLQLLNLLRGDQVRLLTLTGPSGVGKTRLALQLAQDLGSDFPDGVAFVPLASIREAALVPSAIAQILRIRETPGGAAQQQVMTPLHDKRLMLVLDNLEQVLDCTPFLADLLANCPRLVILATSRSPLRLRAEREHLLSPLSLEDAVALFCERAEIVQPGRVFPVEQVAPICDQLDCLPLAIELAAMHTRLLSLTELRSHLTHRFALLRDGARDLPARQQTMEDAIAWSYDLLSESQQRCFRSLGVFVGGWTLAAAEAVCWPVDEVAGDSGGAATEDRLLALAALVEASLVQTERNSAGVVRFSVLELIREFALKRLRAAGELDKIQYRHAVYYSSLSASAEELFESSPAEPDLSLAKELSNVQAALQWAETHHAALLGLRLAGFARLWHMLGQPSQAEYWVVHMLALDERARKGGKPAAPLSLRIQRLYGLGRILLARGKMELAEVAAREALQLAERSADESGMTGAWATLGLVAQASGKLDEAEEAFNQSRLHAGLAAEPFKRYRATVWVAEIARARGDLASAATLLEEALSSAQLFESGWDAAIILTLMGHLARQQGNFSEAIARYRQGLKRLQVFGSPTYIAWCLEGIAAALVVASEAQAVACLCGVAAHLRQQADTPLPANELEDFERMVSRTREILGQSSFLQHWTRGAGFTQDEAVKFAQSLFED